MTYNCIFEQQLCDGIDDCGDSWDEDPTMCGQWTHRLWPPYVIGWAIIFAL